MERKKRILNKNNHDWWLVVVGNWKLGTLVRVVGGWGVEVLSMSFGWGGKWNDHNRSVKHFLLDQFSVGLYL